MRADLVSLLPWAVLIAALLLLAAAEYFRHLDNHLIRHSRRQIIIAILVAAVIAIAGRRGGSAWAMAVTGPTAVAAAIVLNREGHGSDPLDAVFSGAMSGLVAGAALLLVGPSPAHVTIASLTLASLAASLGAWTIGGTAARRVATTAGTTLAATAAALVPAGAIRLGAPPIAVSSIAGFLPSVLLAASVVARRRTLREELSEESALGVIPAEEIASVVHPFRRLARCGWQKRDARRRFVTLATELARRKHKQRSMDPQSARLQQLEILKIRMELMQVLRVHHLMKQDARRAAEGRDEDVSSDTIGAR